MLNLPKMIIYSYAASTGKHQKQFSKESLVPISARSGLAARSRSLAVLSIVASRINILVTLWDKSNDKIFQRDYKGVYSVEYAIWG